MADRKITDLTALAAGSQATGDLLTIVDVSEIAAADKNKKITVENLLKGIPSSVGIGTASPSGLLHLAASSEPSLYFEDTGSSNTLSRIYKTGSALTFNSRHTSAGQFVFNSENSSGTATERLRIDSSGNVGIGTSSPNFNLSVKGSADCLMEVQSSSNNRVIIEANTSGNNRIYARNGSNGAGSLEFITGTSTEVMRIHSSGRVGIGTTNPTQKLDIRGSVYVGTNIGINTTTPTTPLSVRNSSTISTYGAVSAQFSDNSTGTLYVQHSSGKVQLGSDTALAFGSGSSATERMRITSVGITRVFSSDQGFNSRITAGSSANQEIFLGRHSATDTTNGTLCFFVEADGDVKNTNNSYGAISDIKLKENIINANSQWTDIKNLQVRNYNFKPETNHSTHTQLGLIAQEVELISPGLVSESPDRDGEGNDLGTVTKSVNYSVVYMKAVKALQEAMDRIETLEASNADLLARVTALEAG